MVNRNRLDYKELQNSGGRTRTCDLRVMSPTVKPTCRIVKCFILRYLLSLCHFCGAAKCGKMRKIEADRQAAGKPGLTASHAPGSASARCHSSLSMPLLAPGDRHPNVLSRGSCPPFPSDQLISGPRKYPQQKHSNVTSPFSTIWCLATVGRWHIGHSSTD